MGDVRGSLLRAPWWVLSLVTGVIFAACQLVFRLLAGTSLGTSVVTAAVMGLVFGAVMGPLARRTNRRYQAALGDLPRAKERDVRRAALRGPVPADPDVRRAAGAVVAQQLATYRRTWWWAVPVWLVFIALSAWLAVTDTRWWLLGVLFFGGFLVLTVWQPRHLRKRQRLLEAH